MWVLLWAGQTWGADGGRVGTTGPGPGAGAAEDWSMHRGGPGRAGMGGTRLGFPLHRIWHRATGEPVPAWGPPARRSYWQRLEHLEARVAEDHVHPVVLAGDAVFQGSTTDDQVRCLDAATGATRWVFRVDGPVRYAPVVADGRVFFGSDDGWVYAVDARTGGLAWRQRPGPRDWRIPGNGRVISSWPVRGGVVVDRGVVHATAGLYPQQGAWACAWEAAAGTARWQVALEDSPEGYLLTTERLLVVPTGRASPIGLDRESGRVVRRFDTGGGTYAVAADGELFGGPGNDGTLTGVAAPTGERLISVKGRNLVAAEGRVYLLENGELKAVDRVRQAELGRKARDLERRLRAGPGAGDAAAAGEVTRVRAMLDEVRRELGCCELWRVACPANLTLIGTPNALVAGGTNLVVAFDRGTGRELWRTPVAGRALALAAAGGRLAVSTDRGGLEVFGAGSEGPIPPEVPPVTAGAANPVFRESEAGVRSWLDRLRAAGMPGAGSGTSSRAGPVDPGVGAAGYAVVAGLGTGRLVEALLRETRWHVVVVDADAARVTALRAEAESEGFYGSRLSAHVVPGGPLPFTDAFANVVVSEAGLEGARSLPWTEAELLRLVRPWGGVGWFAGDREPQVRGGLDGAGEWTHQYGNPSNTANSGDRRVGARLGLQWFGGPGPDVMVDRHLRGPAPLSSGGRLFVSGENRLLAVDACNGAGLWQVALPGSQRYTMPYDAGYQSVEGDRLAIAVRDACWLLRAGDGAVLSRVPVPLAAAPGAGAGKLARSWHWGWTVLSGGGLFGSAQWSTASRTVPSYEQIDVDYNNDQPLVTGRAVFRVEPDSGRTVWRSERGAILNPTLTLHRGLVLFVEGRAGALAEHATGRLPLDAVLRGDPWLVALSADTGRLVWERRLEGTVAGSRNILFLSGAEERLVLAGSRLGAGRDSGYLVECRRLADGEVIWTASHPAGKPGEFTHGEQVHHPVILGEWLVAEPVAYELATGRRLSASGSAADWQLVRPGHSCGTLSGAGDCLFFRAGNPTVLDLRAQLRGNEPARKLAPSRTGCWINMIPAAGLLLVPEASAGCVCQYSLQTSMAFRPLP